MSHFSLVACVKSPDHLEAMLAPYSESLEVEPYRDYEGGDAKDYWAVAHLREENGLNPDDATITWAEVAAAFNERYGADEQLLIDQDGRAFTMSTHNPDSKWDYWRIGGRWGGYFRMRQGCFDQVIKPERGWDSPSAIPAGTCDGGPKSALDLDALRAAKGEEARKAYAEYHALVAGTPEALPWSHFVDRTDAEDGYTIQMARAQYHAQPRVQRINDTDFRWHDDPIGEFAKPEALHVETARARAVPGYAVLTLDGNWMAPGRMGWFGMSSDSESERIGYWEAANAYIESLPDDVWLIAVDCHI